MSATTDHPGDLSGNLALPRDSAALLAALRDSEDAYRRLFDFTPLPMWVRDGDTFRFLDINHAAIEAYGYTREEFLAMTVHGIRPPEERERLRAYLSRQAPSPANAYSGRWTHRRKNGTLMTVETWSHILVFRGRPARLIIARDITAQLHAEVEAQVGRERFQLIAAATSDAVWDWDFEANTLWWGESFYKQFGYHPNEFSDAFSAWSDALHPEDRERVTRSLHAARDENREFWREQYRFRRKDGTYATVLDRGRVVRDAAGVPHRMVGGMTDITEQSRLQSQYLRAQRMESIGTLAGGIAHDLNNLLTPILLATELAQMHHPSAEIRRYLGTIETSARRGADLVRQVLTFARGVEGKRVPVQIGQLVHSAARFASETFPRPIRVRTAISEGLWPISADATQLNQVLLNLASNARDAMPDGGQLLFAADNAEVDATLAATAPSARPGPHVVLVVSDTGIGIPPEHLERIFEPFFTTKEVGKGTGLGLPTVHAIVREHGGFITVQSDARTGSVFKVHLPAQPGIEIPVPPEFARFSPSARPGDGETILIIDDEPALRDLTRYTLESRGFTVLTAVDGAEGVAVFAQNREKIALVITGMAMPVMDGAATISALHRIDPRLPIVATSGHDPCGRMTRSVRGEIRHFLAKPFSTDQLLAAVARGLGAAG